MATYDQNYEEQNGLSKSEFTAYCPSCGCPLTVDEKQDSIVCPQCDNSYKVRDLSQSTPFSTDSYEGTNYSSLAMSIDTPESGLVYLENFFANYNWEVYMESSPILIDDINMMVEKNKIKNGANASAWILDYESKATPLEKKLEGLGKLELKMAEQYNPIDNTNSLEYFDVYSLIIRNLVNSKDALTNQLSNDIEYAKKFGASSSLCDEMSSRLSLISKKLEGLTEPKKLDDVQSISAAKEKLNNEIARKLAANGIDASSTYFEALSIYQSHSRDNSRALQLFESIKGFSDSADYVAKINKYFNYDYDLFSFFGKHFVFKLDKIALFNVDDKKQQNDSEENTSVPSFALYEVIDGIPSEEALLKGLTKLLTCYSNKLFYISKNKNICCYDVNTYEETVIVEGKPGCFETINNVPNFYLANDGKAFFMRKIIPLNLTTGCFASIKESFLMLFGKKKEEAHNNNYSLVYVDMTSATSSTLVEELIDITDYYGDNLFYFVGDKDPQSEAVHFMECNVLTGETKELLDDSCDIHNVIDGKVVYSVWTPNDLNKDLYVYDLASGESTLIEKNIYSYFKTIKGRIYYTVGNKFYCPLFSNNTEGTDRVEIMQNVVNIAEIRGDWMYIVKSTGKNSVLMKMSTDGKRRKLICNRFDSIVHITDSYIYYIDVFSVLHVVRNDGMDDRIIAGGMKRENIIIGYDSIYYLRKEDITPNKYAYSLYKMDLSGHNSRKLIFNVDSFQNYDEEYLYLKREEKIRFEITTPTTAKDTITDYQTYDVTRYFKFNKNTEEIDLVLSLGLPKEGTYEFKSGCLKKKVEAKSSFREVPNKSLFKHNNLAAAGSTYQSQMDKMMADKKRR